MVRIQKFLLVLWIGTLSADRIDLLRGAAPGKLTPFLFLSPLVLVVFAGRLVFSRVHLRHTGLRQRLLPYCIVCAALVYWMLLSIVFGMDPQRGVVTLTLLILQCTFTLLIFCILFSDEAMSRVLETGIRFGILLFLVFDLAEIVAWTQNITVDVVAKGSWQGLIASSGVSYFVPRLSGPCDDPNRGAFAVAIYALLLLTAFRDRRVNRVYVWIGALEIMATVSVSGILAFFLPLAYLISRESGWGILRLLRRTFMTTLVLAALVLATRFSINADQFDFSVQSVVSAKFDSNANAITSASEHLKLLKYGFEIATSTIKREFLGIGFGSSSRVLTNYFGNDKYANFHSLFVSVLTETGFPGLLVLCLLMFTPLWIRRGALPLLLAAAIFNVPYQAGLDPIFWLMLVYCWSLQPRSMLSREGGGFTVNGERHLCNV